MPASNLDLQSTVTGRSRQCRATVTTCFVTNKVSWAMCHDDQHPGWWSACRASLKASLLASFVVLVYAGKVWVDFAHHMSDCAHRMCDAVIFFMCGFRSRIYISLSCTLHLWHDKPQGTCMQRAWLPCQRACGFRQLQMSTLRSCLCQVLVKQAQTVSLGKLAGLSLIGLVQVSCIPELLRCWRSRLRAPCAPASPRLPNATSYGCQRKQQTLATPRDLSRLEDARRPPSSELARLGKFITKTLYLFKERAGCDTLVRAQRSVSRLYEYGACVSDRQNQFNSYPDCSSKSGSVTAADTETCRRVFANGAHLAVVFHNQFICALTLEGAHCI